MASILRTAYSNVLSWMKIYKISIKILLKFVLKGSINNIWALVQTMAWYHPGDKPLIKPMMVRSLTQVGVFRPL